MNPQELAVLQAMAHLLEEHLASQGKPMRVEEGALGELRQAMRAIGWPVTERPYRRPTAKSGAAP